MDFSFFIIESILSKVLGKTALNKNACGRVKRRKITVFQISLKCGAEQLSTGSSARPGFHRSEALQQSAVPRSFKNERQAELFGKGVSARLATSEILPF